MLLTISILMSSMLIIALLVVGPENIYRDIKHIVLHEPHTRLITHNYDPNRTRIYKWLWAYATYSYDSSYYTTTMDHQGIVTAGCFRGTVLEFQTRILIKSRHPIALNYYLKKLAEFETEFAAKAAQAATE